MVLPGATFKLNIRRTTFSNLLPVRTEPKRPRSPLKDAVSWPGDPRRINRPAPTLSESAPVGRRRRLPPNAQPRPPKCARPRTIAPRPPFAPRLSPSHPARPGLRAPPRDWWTPAKQTLPRLRARLRSVRARAFPNDVFPRSFRFFSRPVAGRRQPGGLLARAACRTTSGRTRTPPRILQSRCLRCTTTSRIS